ncbi:uncharacterized protein CANTADRAFT_259658 [Suhomyces tanzawaensis NRRL Y-17324]|uniref:Uncharacterized protein n=1 Tax=Suhomyces tanzawaensis NRRL Y-17324 TaxID=984487 RepID=A0A1E4SIZ2_9ASCO|nr:uncharacterized protein CANTADRAFT_259658 [Suhomyces tanzawaensis NRRL Y-17324]ODV79460.1 hypothetical protein CANTADRAFT_259658 [Suhomyces tanzawaensis NRRL Y-17324]
MGIRSGDMAGCIMGRSSGGNVGVHGGFETGIFGSHKITIAAETAHWQQWYGFQWLHRPSNAMPPAFHDCRWILASILGFS